MTTGPVREAYLQLGTLTAKYFDRLVPAEKRIDQPRRLTFRKLIVCLKASRRNAVEVKVRLNPDDSFVHHWGSLIGTLASSPTTATSRG